MRLDAPAASSASLLVSRLAQLHQEQRRSHRPTRIPYATPLKPRVSRAPGVCMPRKRNVRRSMGSGAGRRKEAPPAVGT